MKKFVYQLVFYGSNDVCGGSFIRKTSTVFTSEEAARKRIPKFTELALAEVGVMQVDKEQPYEVQIIPLEVIDDVA